MNSWILWRKQLNYWLVIPIVLAMTASFGEISPIILIPALSQKSQDKVSYAQIINYAPNPSFEEGINLPIGWEPNSNPGVLLEWKLGSAHTGVRSVCIYLSANSEGEWKTYSWIPVQPYHTYSMSVWVRGDGTSSGYPVYRLIFYNSDFELVGREDVIAENPSPTWNYYKRGEVTALPEARWAKLVLRHYTITNPSEVCFDDVLFEGDPLLTYFPLIYR
jgi:hypothetical protein